MHLDELARSLRLDELALDSRAPLDELAGSVRYRRRSRRIRAA